MVGTDGKGKAVRIINDANLNRQSISNEDKKVKEIRDEFEIDIKIVERLKLNVIKKYEKVIQEYDFPIDLIEGVCLGKVFQQ